MLSDPPAYAVTLGDDALWLAHFGIGDRYWLSYTPRTGGTVTHVAPLRENLSPPIPTRDTVWVLNAGQNSRRWTLLNATRSGCAEVAADWRVEDGLRTKEVLTPEWTAEGDDAWIFIEGELVRVHKD